MHVAATRSGRVQAPSNVYATQKEAEQRTALLWHRSMKQAQEHVGKRPGSYKIRRRPT